LLIAEILSKASDDFKAFRSQLDELLQDIEANSFHHALLMDLCHQ
jgi:hypothetical protein